jgi:hypothetical protein
MGIFGKAKPQPDKSKPVDLELGPSLFKAVARVLEDSSGTTDDRRVAYAGRNVKQSILVVGESNYQDSISKFEGFCYGFLIPEQDNKFDKNAVALYLILETTYEIEKVGYLPKELAAKVSKPIANLLVNQGQVVPVLVKVVGGTVEKPNLGVSAWAMTDSIKFG